jgi:hypothetical protein
MSLKKTIGLLVAAAAMLGVVAVSSRPAPHAASIVVATAPAALPPVQPQSQAKVPFTSAELIAHLAQPAEPVAEHPSAEADAHALAAMKLGIEAQAPNVQRIYYRAQVNAAPQLLAMQQQQVVALQQNGAGADQIAAAKAALQATVDRIEKSRSELARLER